MTLEKGTIKTRFASNPWTSWVLSSCTRVHLAWPSSVRIRRPTHRDSTIFARAWRSSSQKFLDPSDRSRHAFVAPHPRSIHIPSTTNIFATNEVGGRVLTSGRASDNYSRPVAEPSIASQNYNQRPSRDGSPGSPSTLIIPMNLASTMRERQNARTDGVGVAASRGGGDSGDGNAFGSGGRAANSKHESSIGNSYSKRSDAKKRQPLPSSSSPWTPAGTPKPPPLQDHSNGGYNLVSSPSELEVMLDQLVAMAAAGQAADTGAGNGTMGGSAEGGGRGGGGWGLLLGGGGSGIGPLAVDCEGVELGRPGGRLCLLQLSARCDSMSCRSTAGVNNRSGSRSSGARSNGVNIWLVDVASLGWRAFQHHSRLDGATSLKSLMENPAVIKYLYDVRRDAVALSSEYGVRLRGVVDLQLADVAVRQAEGGLRAGSWVEGLVSALSRGLAASGRAAAPACLAEDLAMATSTSRRYHESNNTQVWSHRPLAPELCEYAATDVRYLHALAEALSPRISRELAEKVLQESSRRTVMTMISNNKDLRAAAPVMISRQKPSGVSEASVGTWRGGERVGRAGSASGSGDGGFSRDAMPYMGLMEWLTAALLLRYDRCGLTAPAVGPPLPPSGTLSAGGGRTAGSRASQPLMAAAPPLYRSQSAAGPFYGMRLRSGSEEPAAATVSLQKLQSQPLAGPGSAAAFDLAGFAAARTATESSTAPPSASKSEITAARTRPIAGTGAAAAEAQASEPSSATAAVAGQPPCALPASGRETALATGADLEGAMSVGAVAAAPSVQSPTMSNSPRSLSRVGEPFGQNGQLSSAHVARSSPARDTLHDPSASPLMPPESSPAESLLLVPSVETLMWAEQSLSQLWLELRAKYDDVDHDEEQKLARLAARWLLASHKGLVILAARPGAAALGSLCWLLG